MLGQMGKSSERCQKNHPYNRGDLRNVSFAILALSAVMEGCVDGPTPRRQETWERACSNNRGTEIFETVTGVSGVVLESHATHEDEAGKIIKNEKTNLSTIIAAKSFDGVEAEFDGLKYRFLRHKRGSSECAEHPSAYVIDDDDHFSCFSQKAINEYTYRYVFAITIGIRYKSQYSYVVYSIRDRVNNFVLAESRLDKVFWATPLLVNPHYRQCGSKIDPSDILRK